MSDDTMMTTNMALLSFMREIDFRALFACEMDNFDTPEKQGVMLGRIRLFTTARDGNGHAR